MEPDTKLAIVANWRATARAYLAAYPHNNVLLVSLVLATLQLRGCQYVGVVTNTRRRYQAVWTRRWRERIEEAEAIAQHGGG